MSKLTYEEVRHAFDYDPETGVLTWKNPESTKIQKGTAAGASQRDCGGRLRVGFKGHDYMAHRIIWLWVTGEHPNGVVDHINGCAYDNRFLNLRVVDVRTNNENLRSAKRTNVTGLLGVTYLKTSGKFKAQIKAKGKQLNLGHFDTAEEAREAYLNAKRKYHAGCTL